MLDRLLQFRSERAIYGLAVGKACLSMLPGRCYRKQRECRAQSACRSYSSHRVHELFAVGALLPRATDAQYRQASSILKASLWPEFLLQYVGGRAPFELVRTLSKNALSG